MNDSKLSSNRCRFFYFISEFIYLRNALNQMLNAIEKEINEAERMVTTNEKDVNELERTYQSVKDNCYLRKIVNHIKFLTTILRLLNIYGLIRRKK
uniref:Uncharacterized protein n=1 Tax=Strongyloides venezuelensis TaxID=75913 RepID=A0A0K0FZE3_STRVS